MPRTGVPSYRLHRPSGRAVVTLNGVDHYLGVHGSPESKENYNRTIAEWLANGRTLGTTRASEEKALTVNDIVAAFWRHATKTYRLPDGSPSSELECLRVAFRPLVSLYGTTPAANFGPKAAKMLRDQYIAKGWVRKSVNHAMSRIKRIFKWAVAEELIPAAVHHGLLAVDGLRAGRSDARESEPVRPVEWPDVEAVLAHVSRQVAAMILVQWWTGCRPGEVVQIRACDIDRSNETWIYRPPRHKTEHLGKQREIVLGPRARDVLRPFLDRVPPIPSDQPVFSPAEAEADRRRELRARRRTKLTPSQRARQRKADTIHEPGIVYDVHAYRRAISRGIEAANAERIRQTLIEAIGRLLPISVQDAIREWGDRLSTTLLRSAASSRLWKRGIDRLIRRCRRQAGKEPLALDPETLIGVVLDAQGRTPRIAPWTCHRLRHSAATRIRREYGLDSARAVLGHSSLAVTEAYAEIDRVSTFPNWPRVLSE